MRTWLVIGIGNTLRRDDGLGPWLAERVAGWNLPGVTVRSVHQLTPELAAEVAAHDYTLFLDARRDGGPSNVVRLEPAPAYSPWTHAPGPAQIVAMSAWLFGSRRQAWLLLVEGCDFGFGEGLSLRAQETADEALSRLRAILEGKSPCTKSA